MEKGKRGRSLPISTGAGHSCGREGFLKKAIRERVWKGKGKRKTCFVGCAGKGKRLHRVKRGRGRAQLPLRGRRWRTKKGGSGPSSTSDSQQAISLGKGTGTRKKSARILKGGNQEVSLLGRGGERITWERKALYAYKIG